MPAYWLEAFIVLTGIVLLLLEAFLAPKDKGSLAWVAFGSVVLTLVLLFFAQAPCESNFEMARYYSFDNLARFFKGFTLIATGLTLILAIEYRKTLSKFTANPDSEDGTGEYYSLILFACAGMMWMASAKDFVSLFISIEITTITFYILVAYMRRNVGSLEAGVKYLILGALSTGFLVYGISWIYGVTGTTDLAGISPLLTNSPVTNSPTAPLFGLALILIALAFKVGAAPMHIWIPDVYQGSPTPTTAFLSVASKGAGFAVALRILQPFLENEITQKQTTLILAILAAITILIGNLAAIAQKNFKRLLAYSSIANAGFILLALAAWTSGSENSLMTGEIVAFYMVTYLVMTFAAFFILAAIQRSTGSEEISAFDGLAGRNPRLALATTLVIGALAGLPLTAGFLGKFFVFYAAVEAQLWWPLAIGFIGVAVGFYYYFKIIRAIYWRRTLDEEEIHVGPITSYVLYTLCAAIIIFGLIPRIAQSLIG